MAYFREVMKLLKALTVCLILPFAFVACDKKEEDKETGDGGSTAKPDTHESITTEYFGYMEDALGAMGSIKDEAAADAFIAKAKEMEPKLQAIMERAKALPAPTDEEKATIQAAQKAVMDKMDAKQAELAKENLATPPGPEVMAAMGKVMEEVMSGDFGKKMEEVTNGMNALYGLEN